MAENETDKTQVTGDTPETKEADANALAPNVDEIAAAAAQERARIELEARSQEIIAAAQRKADEIVEQARKEADEARADAGLVPSRVSDTNVVEGGNIQLRYLGTSDQFYVGADKDGRAVYAKAGGDPVKVTAEIRDVLTHLPNDRFEEVK